LTLIATMPNMVISDALGSAGLKPLRFFSFSPIGLAVLSLGIVYMLAIGNRLLSSGGAAAPSEVSRSLKDLWNEFTVGKRLESVRVPAASPLAGQTIREAEIETRFGVHVLGISRTPIGGRDREIEDA